MAEKMKEVIVESPGGRRWTIRGSGEELKKQVAEKKGKTGKIVKEKKPSAASSGKSAPEPEPEYVYTTTKSGGVEKHKATARVKKLLKKEDKKLYKTYEAARQETKKGKVFIAETKEQEPKQVTAYTEKGEKITLKGEQAKKAGKIIEKPGTRARITKKGRAIKVEAVPEKTITKEKIKGMGPPEPEKVPPAEARVIEEEAPKKKDRKLEQMIGGLQTVQTEAQMAIGAPRRTTITKVQGPPGTVLETKMEREREGEAPQQIAAGIVSAGPGVAIGGLQILRMGREAVTKAKEEPVEAARMGAEFLTPQFIQTPTKKAAKAAMAVGAVKAGESIYRGVTEEPAYFVPKTATEMAITYGIGKGVSKLMAPKPAGEVRVSDVIMRKKAAGKYVGAGKARAAIRVGKETIKGKTKMKIMAEQMDDFWTTESRSLSKIGGQYYGGTAQTQQIFKGPGATQAISKGKLYGVTPPPEYTETLLGKTKSFITTPKPIVTKISPKTQEYMFEQFGKSPFKKYKGVSAGKLRVRVIKEMGEEGAGVGPKLIKRTRGPGEAAAAGTKGSLQELQKMLKPEIEKSVAKQTPTIGKYTIAPGAIDTILGKTKTKGVEEEKVVKQIKKPTQIIKPKARAKPITKPKAKEKPAIEAKTEAILKMRKKEKPAAKPKPEAIIKARPKTKPIAKPKPKTKLKPITEPIIKLRPKTKLKPKPKLKPPAEAITPAVPVSPPFQKPLPARPSLFPGEMFKRKKKKRRKKKRMFKRPFKYKPSLAGMEFARPIKKAPKKIFGGISIRPPVTKKEEKKKKKKKKRKKKKTIFGGKSIL